MESAPARTLLTISARRSRMSRRANSRLVLSWAFSSMGTARSPVAIRFRMAVA